MASLVDLLGQLTSAQRALLPFFESAAASNKTSSQILAELRESGRGIRTQVGLDIIGILRDNIDAGRQLRNIGPDVILNPALFGQGTGGQNRNYLFKVLARGVSSNGETLNRILTVSTNDLLTKNQILDTAKTYAYGKGTSGNYAELTSIEVIGALASPALG
jgi:hypothetical protein